MIQTIKTLELGLNGRQERNGIPIQNQINPPSDKFGHICCMCHFVGHVFFFVCDSIKVVGLASWWTPEIMAMGMEIGQ